MRQRERIIGEVGFEEVFPELEGIISQDRHTVEPQGGIMDWTEELYLQYLGLNLRTFGPDILCSALRAQSSMWEVLTRAYMSDITLVVH
jgi:hypothetical protein